MDRSVFSIFVLRKYFIKSFKYYLPDDILYEIINRIADDFQFACSDLHMVVLKNRVIYACGNNDHGQLGLGDYNIINKFCEVNIKNVVKVVCGDNYTVVLTHKGHVYTSGCNDYGQLGLGDNEGRNTFNQVMISEFICDIACGSAFTIALTSSGEIYSWGHNNYGQLGLNKQGHENKPCKINFENADKIFCGGCSMFVLTKDNTLFSTGFNCNGELGLGHDNYVIELTKVLLVGISHISLDSYQSIALTESGTLLGNGLFFHEIFSDIKYKKGHFSQLNTSIPGDIAKVICCHDPTFIITKQGNLICWNNSKRWDCKNWNSIISDINNINLQDKTLLRDIYDATKYTAFSTQNGKLYIMGKLGDTIYKSFTEISF